MAAQSSVCEFGRKAVDFDLPGVDGGRYSLALARISISSTAVDETPSIGCSIKWKHA